MTKKVFIHLESNRGYSRDLLKGIYDYNNLNCHWEIFFEPAYFLKNSTNIDRLLLINRIKPDGCILEKPSDIAQFSKLQIPIVQVTSVNQFDGIPLVKGNYESDARIAYDYFRSKGFRKFAFLGIEGLEWSTQRLIHFSELIRQQNFEFNYFLLKGNEEDILTYNFEALITWIRSLPKQSAVLCCNDDFAQILINACSMANRKVPHEISVLGIDNDELICNICRPNLSSITRNHKATSYQICETLNALMLRLDVSQKVIFTEGLGVIERASTDTLAIEAPEVKSAIAFISQNITKGIEAQHVASHSNCSLKVLNQKFYREIGHSVFQEIQQRKMNCFKELLSTNKSVKEIAFEMGFNDHSHVSRWFSQLEGITPMEWRRKIAENL